MSIINTMLQDLDKRNGRSGGEVTPGEAIRSVKPVSPWHLGRNTLFVFAALVLASLAGAWWLQQRNGVVQTSRIVAPALPVPVLAQSPPPATSPMPAALPAPTALPVPMVGAAEVPASAKPQAPAAPAAVRLAVAPMALVAVGPSGTRDRAEPPPLPAKPVAMSPKTPAGKIYSDRQVSANLLAEAVTLDQQGRQDEAKLPLQRLLAANPLDVQARQMLIQLQLDTGHVDDARLLLAEAQRLYPDQSNFTLALARLQVERGDVKGAIQLLEADRPGTRNDPQLRAFLAALLLGNQRYDDAMQHYLVALRSDPANAVWLMGVAVAFENLGKRADAVEAYRRADGTGSLTPEMANFVSARLAAIGR